MNDGPATEPVPEAPDDILTTIFEPVAPPSEGAYGFTCNSDALRTALAKFGPRPARPADLSLGRRKLPKFRLAPAKEPKAPSPTPIRIVVYPDRVKFGAKLGVAFAESILPTVGPMQGFSTRSDPISFVFDLNVLLKVASQLQNNGFVTAEDGSRKRTRGLTFVYEPVYKGGTPNLQIRNLNFGTFPKCDVDAFVKSLGAITPVTVFDPKVLCRGLLHARLFAKMRCDDRRLTIIEARGGRLFGADLTGLCIFEAPGLTNVAIRIPLKTIGVFRRVLGNLEPATVRLLDSNTHHIIRDHLTCLAWPKTTIPFPPIEAQWENYNFDDRVTVSRSRLRQELRIMKIIPRSWIDKYVTAQDDDKDFLPAEHDGKAVQLRVSGQGPAALLSLHIRDANGIAKGESHGISCNRAVPHLGNTASPVDVMVDLASFLRVVEHFRGHDVCFGVTPNGARFSPYLLIEDEDQDGAWRARTFLELVPHIGRPSPLRKLSKRRRGSGRGV